MSALDMMRADSRIITALGPIDVGPVEEIAATVRSLAASGGSTTPFGLLPSTESKQWRYCPEDFLDEVVELPGGTTKDLPALLTDRARTGSRSKALRIAVAGDHLIVDMCHGLGDGRLITMLNDVLGNRLPPDGFPDWAQGPATGNPLGRAIARFYSSDPRRAAATLRSRRRAAPVRRSDAEPVPDDDLVPWHRAPAVVAARTSNGAVDGLRRLRDRTAPHLSVASLVFASISSEIRSRGMELQKSVNVIFDCRRYLSKRSRVYGNFVSGVDLAVPDPGDPNQLNRAIVMAGGSGRPLAALLLSAQKFRHTYRIGQGYVEAAYAPQRPQAKLVFSDNGRAFVGSEMWRGDAGLRFYNAINEPKEPDAIVFTVSHHESDIDLTASFHANVFSSHAIQAALDDVVRQLEGHFMLRTGT